MLRAVIIDDEESGIETLKILASRNSGNIRIVASTLNAGEGITLIEDYKPDVVFLDILMPAMSGFDLLSKLSFSGFKLIFTTAHREHAIEAIKNRAFDYLLKPIGEADFRKCVEDILEERNKTKQTAKQDLNLLIEIQVKDGILYLKQKDIIRLEASGSYTEFYMDNGICHIASKGLRDVETRLDTRMFYRCHKSHIINLLKVEKFVNHKGHFAVMSDGSKTEISKALKDAFLERLKNF